jgi:hypothetical protein
VCRGIETAARNAWDGITRPSHDTNRCVCSLRLVAGIAGSNPARGMDVCLLCLCVVLSYVGRCLCDGLITRPEESYRVSKCMWFRNLKGGGQGPIWAVEPLDGWICPNGCFIAPFICVLTVDQVCSCTVPHASESTVFLVVARSLNNILTRTVCTHSVWLRTGRPGDRGSFLPCSKLHALFAIVTSAKDCMWCNHSSPTMQTIRNHCCARLKIMHPTNNFEPQTF